MRRGQSSTAAHCLFLVTRPPAVAFPSFFVYIQRLQLHCCKAGALFPLQQAGVGSVVFSNYAVPSSSLLVTTPSITLHQCLFHSCICMKFHLWLILHWTNRYRQADTSLYFSVSSVPSCLQICMSTTSQPGGLTMLVCSDTRKYVAFLCILVC